jgi:hypothetical protein
MKGSGLLGSRCEDFFSHRRAGFISFQAQVSPFPAQYKIGGQLLTPKIGTGKGLTCGPSLLKKYHSAENSPQRIGQRYLRSVVRRHSAEGLFALEKGSIREYVMTWPGYKEGTN